MVRTPLQIRIEIALPNLQDDPAQKSQDPEDQAAMQDLRHRIDEGMAPTEVADRVFEAIRKVTTVKGPMFRKIGLNWEFPVRDLSLPLRG